MLVRYYHQIAKTRALYESTNGPADNPSHSDRLVISIVAFLNWLFGSMKNLDHQLGNSAVPTRTRTQCDRPELLLTSGRVNCIDWLISVVKQTMIIPIVPVRASIAPAYLVTRNHSLDIMDYIWHINNHANLYTYWTIYQYQSLNEADHMQNCLTNRTILPIQ